MKATVRKVRGGGAKPDPAVKALAGVRAAVSRLARLMNDPDPGVVERASRALVDRVGALAVDGLAVELLRAASPWHGLVICGALLEIGMRSPAPVLRAVTDVMKRSEDSDVSSMAAAVYRKLAFEGPGGLLDEVGAAGRRGRERTVCEPSGPTPQEPASARKDGNPPLAPAGAGSHL